MNCWYNLRFVGRDGTPAKLGCVSHYDGCQFFCAWPSEAHQRQNIHGEIRDILWAIAKKTGDEQIWKLPVNANVIGRPKPDCARHYGLRAGGGRHD